METNQDSAKPISGDSLREGCVVFMIVFTMFIGFISLGTLSLNLFTFVIALGLSTLALSILHLSKVLQHRDT